MGIKCAASSSWSRGGGALYVSSLLSRSGPEGALSDLRPLWGEPEAPRQTENRITGEIHEMINEGFMQTEGVGKFLRSPR